MMTTRQCKGCGRRHRPDIWELGIVAVLAAVMITGSALAADDAGIGIHGQAELRRNSHAVGEAGENYETKINLAATWGLVDATAWTRFGLRSVVLYGGFPHGTPVRFDGGTEIGVRGPNIDAQGLYITPRLLIFGGESRHTADHDGSSYTATWAGLGTMIQRGGWTYEIEFKRSLKSEAWHPAGVRVGLWLTPEDLQYVRDPDVTAVALACEAGTTVAGCTSNTQWRRGDVPRRWLALRIEPPSQVYYGRHIGPYVETELVQAKRRFTDRTARCFANVKAGVQVDFAPNLYVDLRYSNERRPEDSPDLRLVRSAWSGAVGVRW